MYYLYLDESGVEGLSSNPDKKNLDDNWFTSGGIIVNDSQIEEFNKAHQEIIDNFFIKKGIKLPDDFKLHYRELRQEQWPYNQFTRPELGQMANVVFNAINSINCRVISASINKTNHVNKPYPYTANVRAYSLLLCLERFQYFLQMKNEDGIGIYEKLTRSMRRKFQEDLKNLREQTNFPFFSNLYKIKRKIRTGDLVKEKVLQFSDFFVYAPHIRLVTNYNAERRFLEIRNKYFNLRGRWNQSGYVEIR